MPSVNVRFLPAQHAELKQSARASGRSLQREIVFRLFGPATEPGETEPAVTGSFDEGEERLATPESVSPGQKMASGEKERAL